jgi:Barrel-sandwich domain of CusB or HlyD membrane-fusion
MAMIDGAVKKLRSLNIPETRINEIREKGTVPRTIEWPAPANGAVIEKKVVNGQRVMPGDEQSRPALLGQAKAIAISWIAEHRGRRRTRWRWPRTIEAPAARIRRARLACSV